mmetsp:Transcript_28915/g.61397  ORF Transcript_28915/g.61397 Transcript_28915/m.61397 type:complete len:281 (+) Transcript_28915:382-1224(+)
MSRSRSFSASFSCAGFIFLIAILSIFGMLPFPFFFFFLSSDPPADAALAASTAFFLSSSACFSASFSAAALAVAASLRALTSASFAMSRLYSSVRPASWRLRYAAALASFSFSSRSFLVIGAASPPSISFSFVIFTFALFGLSTSIRPSTPLGLYSFSTHSPSPPSSPTFISATRRPTSMASLSASRRALSTDPSSLPPPSPPSSSASARRLARAASNSARRALRCSISSALWAANRLPDPRPPPRLPLPRAMIFSSMYAANTALLPRADGNADADDVES